MWLFTRDPAKDINYDFGKQITGLEDKSLWDLYEGKKKGATGDVVSIFAFNAKEQNKEAVVELAKSSFKRAKILRHPNFVTYLDGLETDKVIYLVTEPVIPLEKHLRETVFNHQQKEMSVSWGIHQITKALSFLNGDASLVHNNICMSSIFVNRAGEWKLGGLDYMYSSSEKGVVPPLKVLPLLEKYEPPERGDFKGAIHGFHKWSTDMWGLGCLIWEVFNGPLPQKKDLKSPGKIPKLLVPHYCEMVSANPKSRPNPAQFIEKCRMRGSYLDNEFVETMLFLEEIQIKEAAAKTKFFTELQEKLDHFPSDTCRYRILPELLNAYEFGNAGSAVLAPLFKLGRLLDAEEYQKRIVPCVVKLFSSTDRAIRVRLLQQMEHFAEHLQPSIVNDKVFMNICTGFSDTNPVLRETTVKSMVFVAPKLNYNNLNVELMKHFARLQSKDNQGGIRANTTVCLGKIAGHLHPQIRQKVLLSAFSRALKDPFPPARIAGLHGIVGTQNYYTINDTATRILPALSSICIDPDRGVREQAFKAVKVFIEKLEKVHENPDLVTEMEADVNSGASPSTAAAAASWAGWAVTSLTSKLYRGKEDATAGSNAASASAVISEMSVQETCKNQKDHGQPNEQKLIREQSSEETSMGNPSYTEEWGNIQDSGWDQAGAWGSGDGDDDNDDNCGGWGSLEDMQSERDHTGTSDRSSRLSHDTWNDWGNEDFVTTTDKTTKPASSYDWGWDGESTSDDFFSNQLSISQTNKKQGAHQARSTVRSGPSPAKPTPSDFSIKDSAASDSWGFVDGDWADDSWTSAGSTETDVKRQREERRKQRQKELQEKREARQGGALKLGAKKRVD